MGGQHIVSHVEENSQEEQVGEVELQVKDDHPIRVDAMDQTNCVKFSLQASDNAIRVRIDIRELIDSLPAALQFCTISKRQNKINVASMSTSMSFLYVGDGTLCSKVPQSQNNWWDLAFSWSWSALLLFIPNKCETLLNLPDQNHWQNFLVMRWNVVNCSENDKRRMKLLKYYFYMLKNLNFIL